MSNKLRQVFSEDELPYTNSIHFKNSASLKRFYDALDKVANTGETVEINGVETYSCGLKSGAGIFPVIKQDSISDMKLSPSKNHVDIITDIDGEKVQIHLLICGIKNGIIIETEENAVIHTKIEFDRVKQTAGIHMTPDINKATDVKMILKWTKISEQLLKVIFGKDDKQEGLKRIKETLKGFRYLFEMLDYLEDKLRISFNINNIDLDDQNSIVTIYEVCFMIRDSKVIRINAKFTSTESTGFQTKDNKSITVGEPVMVTFSGEKDFSFWGETIKLHCIYMLCNAFIKSISDIGNGEKRITYGDSEIAPLYCSYRGYVDEKDAEDELNVIMDHEDNYKNAKTTYEYINEI